MTYHYILAKSTKNQDSPEEGEKLFGHTQKVIESFRTLFGSDSHFPTRLALQWMRFFKLSENDFEPFYVNGLLSCGFHDIGKANTGFQDMLFRKGVQVIRHEHLSGLILWLPEIRNQLEQIPHIDLKIILSAVIGHHLKCAANTFAQLVNPDIIKSFRVFLHAIQEIWKQLPIIPDNCREVNIPEIWSFNASGVFHPFKIVEEIKKKVLGRFKQELRKNDEVNRMLMAARAALILSDSLGSAIVRENKDIKEWMKNAFSDGLKGDYIETNVIQPRLNKIIKEKGFFAWNDFQNAMETLPSRALLLAPCGSGKTLAAWRWIKARLSEKPAARVIFLYPTRATATEGFRDYVSWAPESDASLVHGTSDYDLEGMFNNPDDKRMEKDFSTDDRLYSLSYWPRKIFSATVDQFLGFMQQVYRSVCLLPLLADSVVVFDEIHSFDKNLFSAFKLFLKNFDVPVLCMTASLPKARRDDLLQNYGLSLFPTEVKQFSDLEAKAGMLRYLVSSLEDQMLAEEIALQGVEDGKRVLWVVNTVARCQALAKKLNVICYHSRFKLEHRKKQHDKVITAFQQKEKPVLVITTQVCEMSLDLDADILISEAAPITAMIQRMGRCNRHSGPGEGKMGKVYFYAPEDEKPYTADDLSGCKEFLKTLDGREVSQNMLEGLLEKFGPAQVEVEKYAAFLTGGPWAMAREETLRNENNFTVNAILNSDIALYFDLRKQKKPVDGLLVPVVKKYARQSKLGRFPLVAESSHYSPAYGFLDYPMEEIL
jgi:CRISPR-associated endonuclease/helicase Cas3